MIAMARKDEQSAWERASGWLKIAAESEYNVNKPLILF